MEALTSLLDKAVIMKQFLPIKQDPNYVTSHLLFVDDIIIFGKRSPKTLKSIKDFLNFISESTSLMMNAYV